VHKLAQTVFNYVRNRDLLHPGDRAGVAVSGGADSVALLRILLELRRDLGVVLLVVHLNHQLRGTESEEDERFVRELAAAHDVPFVGERVETKAFAAKKKLSIEAAARELRYEFFREALAAHDLDKIATAHTLDDQAETVLLKLLRGAGTKGLAGIYPRLVVRRQAPGARQQASSTGTGQQAQAAAEITFMVRPLLAVRRLDLEAYISQVGQSWREDSTNRELRHTRNRIRHEILPRLTHVNPRARETLAEAAEIARSEEDYWAARVSDLLPQVWKHCDGGGVLHWRESSQLDLALKRRLIRAAAQSLGINLEFHHVEEVLGLDGATSRATLPNGWCASSSKGGTRFARRVKTPGDYEYALEIPGTVTVSEAKVTIAAEVLSSNDIPADNHCYLLSPRFATGGLVVRNWRTGERFWPQHAKQAKKIKELLQDRHITGEEKKLWPLIACGREVVWVKGLGVRRDFQARGGKCVLIQAWSTAPPSQRSI
jgi:tRNA(Ile)-lysidine synthase